MGTANKKPAQRAGHHQRVLGNGETANIFGRFIVNRDRIEEGVYILGGAISESWVTPECSAHCAIRSSNDAR